MHMFCYHAKTIIKIGYSYSGAIIWNSLPCDVREAQFLGSLNAYSKVLSKAWRSWKAVFLFNY